MTINENDATIFIANEAYRYMTEHAMDTYPYEGCGVLIGNTEQRDIDKAIMITNDMTLRESTGLFRIDPLELYELERKLESEGLEIAGFYHSHPDAEAVLSVEDTEHMIPELIYIIVSVTAKGCADVRGYIRKQLEEVCELSIKTGKVAEI